MVSKKKQKKLDVLILMGSESDWEVMKSAFELLKSLGISTEAYVSSAHRTPERTEWLVLDAQERGVCAIIAGAGLAAHLAGAVAAKTVVPVIGVPLSAGTLGGLDALLSTVQMPPGIPVATVAIGKHGAINAAYLAAQIIALTDPKIRAKLIELRKNSAKKIEESVLGG